MKEYFTSSPVPKHRKPACFIKYQWVNATIMSDSVLRSFSISLNSRSQPIISVTDILIFGNWMLLFVLSNQSQLNVIYFSFVFFNSELDFFLQKKMFNLLFRMNQNNDFFFLTHRWVFFFEQRELNWSCQLIHSSHSSSIHLFKTNRSFFLGNMKIWNILKLEIIFG